MLFANSTMFSQSESKTGEISHKNEVNIEQDKSTVMKVIDWYLKI